MISDKSAVVIHALGHDMTEATCTEAAHCQRQGCDYTEGTALGHADENADNECDSCGMSMETDQPTTPGKPVPGNPQTGDDETPATWIMLFTLSFVGICICVLLEKKRNMA